jgi:CRISPR-associated protein Csb2
VNEGIVEWPPSPWRILRSLISTRHRKARSEVPEPVLRRLVETLAGQTPVYRLPPAVSAHSRHYMPPFKGNKTRVFDAFQHVSATEPLLVGWPEATLPDEQLAALALLLARTGYLGRAESWVEMSLGPAFPLAEAHALPRDAGASPPGDGDGHIQPVLCPEDAEAYAEWRVTTFEQLRRERLDRKRLRAREKGRDPAKEKLTGKDRESLEASLPAGVFEALHVETTDLRRAGWNRPPGSRWVDYRVAPGVRLERARVRRRRRGALPTVARFAVASAAPPLLTEAVSVADRVRTALLSRSDAAPVFSGRTADGAILEGHRHAHVLPEANGRHGRISHVTIFARMGFDARARNALDGLHKVWGHGGHDLQLVLIGLGKPEDFAGVDLTAGECPLLLAAAEWISRTPFVPTRHPKSSRSGRPKLDEAGRQVGSPEHDLRRLLRTQGYPEPEVVEGIGATLLGGHRTPWRAFRVERTKGGGRRANARGGFRIRFPHPVRGPLALGYGAHFGLGSFVPKGASDDIRL